MATMPEILRSLRTAKGMTQSKMAELLGLTTNAYQSYERGTSEPSCKALCILADFYGTTTDYLLGRGEPPDPLKTFAAQTNVSPDVLEKQFEALPDEGKMFIMTVIAALKEMRRKESSDGGSQKKGRASIRMRVHRNKTAAGFGYDLTSEDEWTEQGVLDGETVRRADFAVEVEGDSMEPDFHDGDLALIQLDPDVPLGKVGLFVVDGKGYIKERGKRCLISRNPDYPNIEGEARCIGLVIGTAERA